MYGSLRIETAQGVARVFTLALFPLIQNDPNFARLNSSEAAKARRKIESVKRVARRTERI